MDKLFVIKIGGNVIDDETELSSFLKSFSEIKERKVLVHGGGKKATNLAQQLGIPQQLVDGRRITDAETLKIVTMVYAGLINKQIVAGLQASGCNAIGLAGPDANLMKAHKRVHPTIDYGYAGDIDNINIELLRHFAELGLTVVIPAITHDGKGQLLNTNADTIAQRVALALSVAYNIELIYLFEKAGVLMDPDDDKSRITTVSRKSYTELKEKKVIVAGMIPKMDNAFEAMANGVKKVIIGKSADLPDLIAGSAGTTLVNE